MWYVLTLSICYGAKFANQFTEFELPPQWQCRLEGAEWVCQSSEDAKKKDAIIVLAAKIKGEQDSLDQYLSYLKSAKIYQSVQGKPVKSDPKYAKSVMLNGQSWVDSLHLESELPGFYTRYLATVKQDIGVLITYSINKAKYQAYLEDFENMVKTLRVFRKTGGINVAPAQGTLFQNTQIPASITSEAVFGGPQIPETEVAKAAPKKKDDDTVLYLIAGGAVLAFVIWQKRRKS